MSLDIAMGGSSCITCFIAKSAGVDFTMNDIDKLSRKIPVLCKVAPNSSHHIEDVNRAGGIMSILGELARASLIDTSVNRIDGKLSDIIENYDLKSSKCTSYAKNMYLSAPAGHKRNLVMASQDTMYDSVDTDRQKGCIRSVDFRTIKMADLRFYSVISQNGASLKLLCR